MILIWRFLFTLLTARFKTKLNFFDTGYVNFYVLPTDVDLLWHMNNGRYLSMMDIGRLNLTIRNGIFQMFRQHQIYPVIASEMIRFKKSLNIFQKYQLASRLVGWDTKYFYLEQIFKVEEKVHAVAIVKSRLLKRGESSLNPSEVLALVGHHEPSPPLPKWLTDWQESETEFSRKINNT